MTNEKTEMPEQEVRPLEPGLMLKQKRESRGMSISEVAERLHITVQYVEALEGDDYKELPGDTFVRGYLRSYARLLGLDPKAVIDAANALIPGDDKEKKRRLDVSRETDPGTRKRPGMVVLLSGAIAISITIAAVTWWRGQQQDIDPVVAPAVADINSDVEPVQPPAVAESSALPEVAGSDSVFEFTPAPEDTPDAIEPLVQDSVNAEPQKTVTVTANTKPAPTVNGNSRLSAGESQDIMATSSADRKLSMTQEKAVAVVKTPAAGDLYMKFVADCWVKITDLSGKVLFVNMQKANTSLDLKDLGAVKLILGNARAVSELRFNDKRVALDSSDGSGNVARLTLGLKQG